MATTDIEYPYIDLRAKLAEIDLALAQTAQARTDVLRATAQTEQANADAARKRQEKTLAPWVIAISVGTMGAAFFAAGAAFMKLLGM